MASVMCDDVRNRQTLNHQQVQSPAGSIPHTRCGMSYHHESASARNPALQQLSSELQKLSVSPEGRTGTALRADMQNRQSLQQPAGPMEAASYQPQFGYQSNDNSQLSGQSSTQHSMCCDDGFDEELSYLTNQVHLSDSSGSRGQSMPYIF